MNKPNIEKIHILLAEARRCYNDGNMEGTFRKFKEMDKIVRGDTMSEQLRGHIINMTEVSNYGFIKGEDNIDYFFHKEDFHGFWDDLVIDYHHAANRNIPVTFEKLEPGEKGPRAGNVKRTDFPNQAV